MSDGWTIALITEHRHLHNRALREARAALEAAGCTVPLLVPDAGQLYEIPTEAPTWDAVLSRGRDLVGFGILAAAAALDVLAINTPQSIELVRNKIAMQAVLLNHGLRLPRSWFAANAAVFRDVPRDWFPLVVKPFDGDGAAGLALLTRPEDVDLLPPLEGRRSVYLAQEFLKTDGWDLKLYGVGTCVWAVRKPAPINFAGAGPAVPNPTGTAEPVDLTAELRDIALTCGRACGLELWGVDVAITAEGPCVMEVNDFPTYSAVPEAGEAIAHHVMTLVRMHAVARKAGRERVRALVRNVL